MGNNIPLYIIGLPSTGSNAVLIRTKLSRVLKRLEKVYSKIDEARVTIERQRIGGKRQHYEVHVLIITPHRRHSYRETGWDLSNVCEQLGQRLLNNLTKRSNKRLKKSIRKIEGKMF